MPKISYFRVYRADAETDGEGSATFRLFYPRNPEQLTGRLPGNIDFGIDVFRRLAEKGHSKIADEKNPIVPASAGSLYLLADGRVVCHRRDRFAPTHKLYHSAYAGHPES